MHLGDVRHPDVRQAGADVPDDGDALVIQMEDRDGRNSEDHRDEGARHERPPVTEAEDDGQTDQPHDEGAAVGVSQVSDQVAQLLKEITVALLDTEQRGQLADHDGQCQADDEAFQDRFGNERREKSHPQQAGHDAGDSGADGQSRGQRDVFLGASLGHVGDDAGGQRGCGRHGRDDEMS